MHDLSLLDDLHSQVDVNLCSTAAIHGFWCQIWAFREAWKFHAIGDSRDSVHRLWLVTQQRELYQQVQSFEQALGSMQLPQAELHIVIELLLMILHVSPEELQRFAGLYGEEAATQALNSLERWWVTEQARRAVWHAGQVLRWALIMPPAELRDFYAIAVYFASLALWAFGHLASSRDGSNVLKKGTNPILQDPDGSGSRSLVIINGDEVLETRSFIAGRPMTPVLTPVVTKSSFNQSRTHKGALVRLDDPNAVLQIARDLYQSNFPIHGEPLPPLVENMGNLMRDLGSLPENRF